MFHPRTIELLYADENVRILLLKNTYRAAVELKWLNNCSGEDLQRVSVKAAQLARRYYVNSWIADDQELGPLSPADVQWAEQMFMAMHNDFGFDRVALVRSAQQPYQELLSPFVVTYAPSSAPVALRMFSDPTQARNWALSL